MPLTPKKLSALSTQATLADDDLVTGIDTSAASPAAKNVNFALLAIANWALAKVTTVSQAEAEARTATTNRWWTAERVGQAIAAGVAGIVSGAQHNWAGAAAPVGTDDNTDGYSQGSLWRWSLRVWVCVDATTNIAVWVELTASPSLVNPMTTAEDIIVGGSGGAPARLAKGTDGQILKMVAGVIAWAAETAGFANPMTTPGDMIVGGTSGAAGRLAKGTDGQALKMVAGAVAWAADADTKPFPSAYVEYISTPTLTDSEIGHLIALDTTTGNVDAIITPAATADYAANAYFTIVKIAAGNVATISISGAAEINGSNSSLTLTHNVPVRIWRGAQDQWYTI